MPLKLLGEDRNPVDPRDYSDSFSVGKRVVNKAFPLIDRNFLSGHALLGQDSGFVKERRNERREGLAVGRDQAHRMVRIGLDE
jgi:hypothetical protein